MEPSWDDDAVVIRPKDYADLPPPLAISEAELVNLTKWLEPTDYNGVDSDLAKHNAARAAGTGTWLLNSSSFGEWLSSEVQGLLWICGIPGAGKSVMAAAIVEKLSEECAGPVLYFFIRNIIDANKTAVVALRDWLAQLLAYSPQLQTELLQCSKTTCLSDLSTEDLWRYLMMGAASVPRCYIIADAVDEMDDSEDFAKAVLDLGNLKPDTVKVVCTSRPSPQVQRPFVRANTMQIRLDSHSVDRDILAYVDLRLNTSGVPVEYHERVKDAVPGRANGLFLYARLAMDTLVADTAGLDKALANLPLDLASMYKELLKENAERTGVTWDVQKVILQFATHATQPLRLLEIADCLFHCYDIADDLGEMKKIVRRSCGNLLEILPNETVSVIHHSLTEFLCGSSGDLSQESGVTHRDLALLCMGYMKKTLPDYPLGEENWRTYAELGNRFKSEREERKSHFSGYAEVNWDIHIRKSTEAGADQAPTIDTLDSILGDQSAQMRKSVCTVHSSDWKSLILKDSTTLQAAIRFQLHHYARIISSRPDLDMKSILSNGHSSPVHASPLVLACQAGYMDVVEALLQRGFDVESIAYVTGIGGPYECIIGIVTALEFAASANNIPLIQLLLRYGASMPELPRQSRSSGRNDTSVLERAARHLEACEVLAPLSSDARAIFNALRVAIREQPANVKLLAAHPLANLNTRWHGKTLLHMAAACHHSDAVRYLLQENANVDDEMRYDPDTDEMPGLMEQRHSKGQLDEKGGRKALHFWAKRTDFSSYIPIRTDEEIKRIFQLLVDAGSNVDSTDDAGNTALHLVSSSLSARLLIMAGADLFAVNKKGQTPILLLRKALAHADDADLMKLLDQSEAKCGKPTPPAESLSPLIHAIRAGDTLKALSIVRNGGVLNIEDEHGNSPLHYTAAICHGSFNPEYRRPDADKDQPKAALQLIRCLCDSGLDINARNSRGQTPLHLFGRGPTEWGGDAQYMKLVRPVDALKAMVDADADMTIRDNDGMTPLHSMIVNFCGDWFELLCSSSVRYHDEREAGFVKHANYPRALSALDWMLERGASLDTQDSQGRTVLFAAAIHTECDHLVQWLVKLGVRATARDGNGNTVYNFTAQQGGIRQNILDMLLPLGLDVKQPNHQGRTALHSLSNLAKGTNRREQEMRERATHWSWNLNMPIFHDIVQQFAFEDINKPDNDGFTPLLLAARANEDLCARLLRLGADPAALTDTTRRNVFHIASESGQTNIVGVVASHIYKLGRAETLRMLINAADVDGKTPLYYAAASGQESTIRILVDFGAHPDAAMCLRGCAAFEPSQDKLTIDAGAYPCGLDDIWSILADWTVDPDEVDQAILSAAKGNYDYTVDTLSSWRDVMGIQRGKAANSPYVLASLQRQQFNRNSLRSELCDSGLQVNGFELLMANREYALAVEHASPALLTNILADAKTLLHRLVDGGFVSMLQKLLNKEIIASLVAAPPTPEEGTTFECLVLEACRRQQPSLRLLSLLVDDLGMDAAGVSFHTPVEDRLSFPSMAARRYKVNNSTLHTLARGGQWWHGTLGIPYIVSKGVDINLRARDSTAIAAAIVRQSEHPLFHTTCAVDSLLRCGADMTPKSSRETSCFQLARNSPAVLALLRPYDCRPDDEKLLSAIEQNDPSAVQALLEKGVDPNQPIRCQGYQIHRREPNMSPLACALRLLRVYTGGEDDFRDYFRPKSEFTLDPDSSGAISTNEAIIQLLLKHGANPNAAHGRHQDTSCAMDLLSTREDERLYRDKVLQLLQLPQIDVNHVLRNPYCQQSTLLEKACDLAEPSFAQALLDRGAALCSSLTPEQLAADPFTPRAKTVLHAFLNSSCDGAPRFVSPVWDRLIADSFINQRPDLEGWVPLHLAVKSQYKSKFAIDLLAAGVDPWTPTESGANVFHLIFSNPSQTSRTKHILEHLVTLPGALTAISIKSGEEPAVRILFRHHSCYGDDFALQALDGLGVDWAELDDDGKSLMHLAAEHANLTHFQFLMDKGLDPRLEDAKHQTPLDLAAEKKATDILSLFEGVDRMDA